MITRLQMVSIYVSDLERALDFYTQKLGFENTAEFDDNQGTKLAWVVPQLALDTELATEVALCEVAPDDPRIGAVSGMVFTADKGHPLLDSPDGERFLGQSAVFPAA